MAPARAREWTSPVEDDEVRAEGRDGLCDPLAQVAGELDEAGEHLTLQQPLPGLVDELAKVRRAPRRGAHDDEWGPVADQVGGRVERTQRPFAPVVARDDPSR